MGKAGKKAKKAKKNKKKVQAPVAAAPAPAAAQEDVAEVMVEPTIVDLWFDPQCPWAWLTSRWLLEVETVRPVRTRLHVMSLSVLNEHKTVPPDERERLDQGWAVVRVTRGVGEHYGPEQLSRFYTALGTRIHVGREGLGRDTLAAALADVGLPPDLVELGDTGDHDEALRADHWAAMNLVGPDGGSPVISIDGTAFVGPVLSPQPRGPQAGEVFDHVLGLVRHPGFYALQRPLP